MTDTSTDNLTRAQAFEERRFLRPDSWPPQTEHNTEDRVCIHSKNRPAGGWCDICRGTNV